MNRFFTLLLAASCLTAVGQIESICGCENENSLSVNLNLVAPEGFKLGEVLFASYGTPTGDCENGFATSGCHAGTTVSVIESYISECTTLLSVYPNNQVFGDPCGGIGKKLCVEIALEPLVTGCMNADACNYNPAASCDNGTCVSCEALATACGVGTVWDPISLSCIIANPADINLDGCVQLNDLLDLLSAYGDCGSEESAWQCGDDLEYGGDNYGTIQIGEQCWFSENLRSNYYSDGSLVESIQNNANWANGNVGMICTYGNNASNEDLYGALYNWYAVADVRGLCPMGWHVPEEVEWQSLLASAGGAAVAGQTLKTQEFWAAGAQGNDALGFDGRPGGYRRYDGTFQTLGSKGYWWTNTAVNDGQATIFEFNSTPAVATYPDLINGGFSVRCIKDTE